VDQGLVCGWMAFVVSRAPATSWYAMAAPILRSSS